MHIVPYFWLKPFFDPNQIKEHKIKMTNFSFKNDIMLYLKTINYQLLLYRTKNKETKIENFIIIKFSRFQVFSNYKKKL